MMLRRRLLALSAVLSVTALVSLAAGLPSAGASAATQGKSYVALGDSYAAGYGIGTSTAKPVAGCDQSTQDYPHQVAARLGLNLTDMSCSGAVTANIDTTPQATGKGTAPLQDSALSASTNLVTVTIGGNDLGFINIVEYCAALSANGPLALHTSEQNCKAKYDPNGQDTLQALLTSKVVPAIGRVLADIKAKAPKAKVIVVDYPAISTDQANAPDPSTYPGSCFSSPLQKQSFPFTDTDIPYLQQLQVELNSALKSSATAAGAGFVETYPQSLTHSACHGTSTPWMNGLTVNLSDLTPATGSLHPNLAGATAMADVVAPAADKALTVATPTTAPTATSSGSGEHPGPAGALVLVLIGIVAMLAVILGLWFRSARGPGAWRPR